MDIILKNVKVVLGIDDNLQDSVLTILINNARSHLEVWLKKHADIEGVPNELMFIIEEMVINRFQKLGSEGMKSESIEGKSVKYMEDDIKPYWSILETYIPKPNESGKVSFF